MVAFKRERNLKKLLLRGDPYSIKSDMMDNETHGYKRCNNARCDSCRNFVDETATIKSFATGKIFKIYEILLVQLQTLYMLLIVQIATNKV